MEKDGIDFVIKKYELAFKNIEFLDSYVPKMVVVYAAFLGLVMVNIEKISKVSDAVPFFILFILVVSLTVLFLLRKISQLVINQKETVRLIEEKFQSQIDLTLSNLALPESWENGYSTAKISRISIIAMSTVVISVVIYLRYFVAIC